MVYLRHLTEPDTTVPTLGAGAAKRNPVLLVVEDGAETTSAMLPICDFLGVVTETIPSKQDLAAALRDHRPMGIVAHLDCQWQDGCHVMMTVAQYDCTLPVLLLTGGDPALAGAADAVEELWRLETVVKSPELPSVARIVDFLFRAGRKGSCTRFLPV